MTKGLLSELNALHIIVLLFIVAIAVSWMSEFKVNDIVLSWFNYVDDDGDGAFILGGFLLPLTAVLLSIIGLLIDKYRKRNLKSGELVLLISLAAFVLPYTYFWISAYIVR